jgi:hypothetical protein
MPDDIETISAIGHNRFNLTELIGQLNSSLGIVPFVGAGLSIPFGFKGWQTFLLSQAEIAGTVPGIQLRILKGEYEEAAEDLLQALARRAFEDGLTAEFGIHRLGNKRLNGAVSYLPQLASGPVVTTNFDRVLETAFEQAGARFEEVAWGAKVPTAMKAMHQNRRCLLKLHGDAEDHTDRVLTLSEYAKRYGSADPENNSFKEPLPSLLRFLLIGRPVLFLGCSLKNDRVVRLLKKIAEDIPDLLHYAVVEKPPGSQFPEAVHYYSSHGIRPIWYPTGEHGYVEIIVRHLSESISQEMPSRRPARPRVIRPGLKATEAFELLAEKLPDAAAFRLVIYRDKLRLAERTDARVDDDPATFIAQAAIHNDEQDRILEVVREEIAQSFWKNLLDSLKEHFVLAISSKVTLKAGGIAHIPLMDFKCAPTAQNVDLAVKAFKEIGQEHGVLLNSGKSFHFYGYPLLDPAAWRAFMGHSLLLSDFVDTRYVGHALINDECRLRISVTRLNPFIPTVVDVW